ncbi:MAG: hypothetical protein ACAH80_02005 [Alphaproteobacteria bacterium]
MTPDAIPPFISKLTDPDEIRTVMDNAKSKNRMDVYWVAFRRFCEVGGKDYSEPLYQDFYAMLAAYESLLTEKNDRKTPASRTRQKLARHGVQKCLEDWAMSKTATQGFTLLVENKMPQYTAEAVVVKHADKFPQEVVAAAQKRLIANGVDISSLKTGSAE